MKEVGNKLALSKKRFISIYICLDYRSSDDKKTLLHSKHAFSHRMMKFQNNQKYFSNKNNRTNSTL